MGISEGLLLRVKNLDREHLTITVGERKSGKDRAMMRPQSLAAACGPGRPGAREPWSSDQAAGVDKPATPHPPRPSFAANRGG